MRLQAGRPSRITSAWRSHTAKVLTSVATMKQASKDEAVRKRAKHRRAAVKQRPFKLTSGIPDAWNPSVNSFVQAPDTPAHNRRVPACVTLFASVYILNKYIA